MRVRLVIACTIAALFAGALGVSGAFAGAGGGATAPPAFDVTVVNPFDKPVPVTMVGDAISVEAAPIKLDPTANTVKVDSSASSPVAVREVREPVNLHAAFVDSWGTFRDESEDYVVPEGKCLVVTNVTVDGLLSEKATDPVVFRLSGGGVTWSGELKYLYTAMGYAYGLSEQVELNVSSGQQLSGAIFMGSINEPQGGMARISGYLLDAPTP